LPGRHAAVDPIREEIEERMAAFLENLARQSNLPISHREIRVLNSAEEVSKRMQHRDIGFPSQTTSPSVIYAIRDNLHELLGAGPDNLGNARYRDPATVGAGPMVALFRRS